MDYILIEFQFVKLLYINGIVNHRIQYNVRENFDGIGICGSSKMNHRWFSFPKVAG